MDLLLGTSNRGKIQEMTEALASLPFVVRTPHELGIEIDPEETGNTFKDNALEKARFYGKASGLPVIADDSGIIVEALKDELGVHTRRWGLGKSATDEEWIAYFLERMKDEENKRASFRCCIAFIDDMGTEYTFEGECGGVITQELEAPFAPGLPFGGCFRPDGYDRVYSLLPMEEKNRISHRGKALEQLKYWLKDQHQLR